MNCSSRHQSPQHFCPSERLAIDEHKYYLSQRAGCDVGDEAAVCDWLRNQALRWRQQKLLAEIAEQRREILKHKWIESEKAGRDLGDRAVADWISRFAMQWRRWREGQEIR
jgi:hypothetical protein